MICCMVAKYSMAYYSMLSCSMLNLNDDQFAGWVQERRNSIASTLELRLSCAIPSNYDMISFNMANYIMVDYNMHLASCNLKGLT